PMVILLHRPFAAGEHRNLLPSSAAPPTPVLHRPFAAGEHRNDLETTSADPEEAPAPALRGR
ncbi:hypothetical protein SAMN05421505_1102, partial [Sinosporangium album]